MTPEVGRPLTVSGALLDGERVGVRCLDGRIEAIGPGVVAAPGEETLDASGLLLSPPLLNGHTHAAMTLFRGSGGDLPLMPWLRERIWPVEAKLEPDDVYWGARLACAEMIRSGTTRFWDMYWEPEATARAVADAGLRATIGAPLIDAGGEGEEMRAAALDSLDHLASLGPAIAGALAPHAIYTVSEGFLRWIAELAAERGVPIHIHLSETSQEVQDCVAEHGERPAAYLDRLGVLGERTLLAHGVWLDPAELDLLADLKLFALAQKHAAADPTAIAAEDAWAVASGARAPLLGAPAEPLTVGAEADFLLLRGDDPNLAIGEAASNLVYAAAGAVVDTTVVAGRVLMRDGVVPELEEIVARARERAARLGL